MKLTFDVRQDIKRFLAIGGVSLALIIGTSGVADAANRVDPDRDKLPTKVELRVTDTAPRDADTDNDEVEDGDEDTGDRGQVDEEDEDDAQASADECEVEEEEEDED